MAIRIGKTPTRLGTYITKTSWLCLGIDWAWEHGADVLSMSYGGGPKSAAVVAALTRARTRGRGGKGSVLVASAGNGDTTKTPVEFPATLPWVLAVAATDDHDRPKRALSNQEPWVSASGHAVDIAAPGVGCYTATVPDPAEGETDLYTNDFSGTSASTPLVAGAAALIIGANPGLSEQRVRAILCTTADKVRTVTYRAGRNDWVGSGRLNVRSALRAAQASRSS
jgi:subtilisin family serine protease